jgi:hypothetical protein
MLRANGLGYVDWVMGGVAALVLGYRGREIGRRGISTSNPSTSSGDQRSMVSMIGG